MRFGLACFILASLTTAAPAKDYRWTLGYGQGTTEAIIRNGRGSSFNIYCPAGQTETTPGMFIEVKAINLKAGEKIAAQIVIDGKSHAFDLDETEFKAEGRAKRSALSALIEALTKSKGKSFVVEFPKLGRTEQFALLGAKKP
jgi:hypothetical protein